MNYFNKAEAREVVRAFSQWSGDFKAELPQWKRPFFVLFLVYLLGIASILRANYSYMDDIGRVAWGYLGWSDFSRYASVFFASLLHADTALNDISPLPQLIAVALTTISSLVIIRILTERFSWWSAVAVIPLGLSPYFLECLSFKFDAPYMALSVLASVFPLLFIDYNKKLYLLMVAVGSLLMLLTYQASSGIFIISLSFLLALRWSRGADAKACVSSFGSSALAFALVALAFKLVIVKEYNNYVSTDLAVSEGFIFTVLANIKRYLLLLWQDSTPAWRLMTGALALCFVRAFTMGSSRKKLQSLLVAVVLVVFCGILSYGAYLVLKTPLFYPRAMYGFGVFLALLGVIAVNNWSEKLSSRVICICLSWSLFVFALAYGNALAEQKRYDTFRLQLVLHDVSQIPNMDKKHMRKIQLQGSAGLSPIVQREAERYKILNRLVHEGLSSGFELGEFYFYNYYKLPGIRQISWCSADGTILYEKGMPVFMDTAYHTIKADDRCIIVKLKIEDDEL